MNFIEEVILFEPIAGKNKFYSPKVIYLKILCRKYIQSIFL